MSSLRVCERPMCKNASLRKKSGPIIKESPSESVSSVVCNVNVLAGMQTELSPRAAANAYTLIGDEGANRRRMRGMSDLSFATIGERPYFDSTGYTTYSVSRLGAYRSHDLRIIH